jgi:hypothetical protein
MSYAFLRGRRLASGQGGNHMRNRFEAVADITYRANLIDGGELTVRLRRAPEAATLADAWARLAALDPGVDPMSIEIEIREALQA